MSGIIMDGRPKIVHDNMVHRHKICLFGLSADPPTGNGGHRGMIQTVCDRNEFDEIWILPVYRHMFSTKRGKQASFEDRIAMCKLVFQAFPNVTVTDAERVCFERAAQGMTEEERGRLRVGTADLLDMLRNSNPNVDFSLMLGSDTFLDLTSWKWRRSRDVIQLVEGRLLVIQRKGVENSQVNQNLQMVNEMVHDPNAAQTLHISSLSSVSSTLVRSSTDENLLNDSVTPDVLQYMKDNKLYAFLDADD